MGERLAKKVLLIGWDAADWKLINPLMERGLMPNLEKMLNNGVMGDMATLQPVLSPMLWNSVATGKTADKHGILGFLEPDPHTGGVRPVSSTSRKVKALWTILTQRGLRSHVLGSAGHPAEPINGISVSPLFAEPVAPLDQPWPVAPASVHPPELTEILAELRLHPKEIGIEELQAFIPRWREIDQDNDPRLAIFARNLAECATVHNVATWILENEEWDFLAVYHTAIDHFCHTFMPYHGDRMESIDEKEHEIYGQVVNRVYQYHDMMLGRLLRLAGPDATVILLSDHGFHSDHLRPGGTPDEPAGPAIWHRSLGILVMQGPHIRQDERIYGATLLDIAPTVLTLFGLPVGADMDGRVLFQAVDELPTVETIPSWEDEPGDSGRNAVDLAMDPVAAAAVIQQFVALGYLEPPGEGQVKAMENAVHEAEYNLSQVYLSTARPARAIALLQGLVERKPEIHRFRLQLGRAYLNAGLIPEAVMTLETLHCEGPQEWLQFLMGIARFHEGRMDESLGLLLEAEKAEPRLPALHLRIGETYLKMGRLEDAGRSFHRALEIDPDSALARVGLSSVHLQRHELEEATHEALSAVGRQHNLPQGHFLLGVALVRLGELPRAIQAFETAASMRPGMIDAHRWRASIYHRPGFDRDRAAHHRREVRRLRELQKTAA